MIHVRPPGAHSMDCWGVKYQDGDLECEQCRFKESCRPAMLDRIVNPQQQPQRNSLPVLRPYAPNIAPPPPPPPPAPTYQPGPAYQTAMVPMPARPYVPPPVNTLPMPKTAAPVAPSPPQVTSQATSQQYYQSSTGWSLPSHSSPNPLAPMFRPGAPSPAYYMTQYPGESVAIRAIKNVILRALEAIFGELMQFFRHWTWPVM